MAAGSDMVAGGGAVMGNPPAHARFFGGNSSGQFLYDSPSSAALQNMPVGPLIRSFGEGRAGLRTASGVRGGGDEVIEDGGWFETAQARARGDLTW